MTDPNITEPDKFHAEQQWWEVYRQIWEKRGVDLRKKLMDWAANEMQKLSSRGAREDFAELCDSGCTPEVLAAIVALFRSAPRFAPFWAEIVGEPQTREKVSKRLGQAADSLEKLFAEVIAEDNRVLVALQGTGHLSPLQLIAELRFYRRMLNLTESLAKDTETRSIGELAKYILVSYVGRATGRFHDRNVAHLLAEVERSAGFNEVAQRMWRKRNYSRLHSHFSQISDFLFAMGVVITRNRT